MDKNTNDELKKLSFEKALESLEKIVAQMENGQLALDDMMKAYEKGQILSAICADKLKGIEKKVEILRKKADGSENWESFDNASESTRSANVSPTASTVPDDADDPDSDLPF